MEEKKELNIYEITVGKYRGKYLKDLLRDRKYCEWLLQQDWFKKSYEFLYNKIKEFDPKPYFIKKETGEIKDFVNEYKYFNLTPIENLEIELSDSEKLCYSFYLKTIDDLKNKIEVRKTRKDSNIYDITAPSKWLQNFEKETLLSRDDFKEFINAYELPNITTIVEEIKKFGGLEYKGGQSYNIAKKRSSEQELYWEKILKTKYKDELGIQFKKKEDDAKKDDEKEDDEILKTKCKFKKDDEIINCTFDFIHIPTNKIFECKLNLKDFDEKQFNKYQHVLDYNIVYLIGYDCVIDTDMETIYTTNIKDYILYQCNIPLLKNPSKFDDIIFDYDICEIENIQTII